MRIIIGDFETTSFNYDSQESYELESRFVCFKDIDTNEKWTFILENDKQVKEMKDFIVSLMSFKNPTRLYFHNLKFDLSFLFDYLPKDSNFRIIKNFSKILQFSIFKIYDNIKNGKVYKNKKVLLDIRDTLMLFPISIEKIGKMLKFPKLKQDYNADITPEYIEYCFRDIEVIEKAIDYLIKQKKEVYDFQLEKYKLPLTFPALMKKIFHYRVQNDFKREGYKRFFFTYLYDDNRLLYQEYIRKNYYFGGRVEVFSFKESKNGSYNDFNSHYAGIMCENLFPLTPYHRYKSNLTLKEILKNKLIFGIEAIVNEQLEIPLIPYRLDNGKILFPKGKKKCFLFRKEIEYLMNLNQDIEVKYIWSCSGYFPLFDSTILKAYKLRKLSHSAVEKWFLKEDMVSLYGKFAEKIEKEMIEIIGKDHIFDYELSNIEFVYENERDMFIHRKIVRNDYLKINIFFSMMICNLARLKLHKYIMKALEKIYVDTDSLVSNDVIEHSNDLGKLKSEFRYLRFQALGCKEYVYEYVHCSKFPLIPLPIIKIQVKMKGFGKQKYDSFNDFIKNFYSAKHQHRLIGFFESLNRKMSKKTVLVYDKFKQNIYDKRWINDDYSTTAFNLENDDFKEMIENNEQKLLEIINNYKNDLEKQHFTLL